MSIRVRLLLLILFATLIPALVSMFHFVEHRDADIAEAAHRLSAEAGRVAHELKDMMRGTAQLHYGLSRARDFDKPDKAACSIFLNDVLKEHPQYTGILTILPDGNLFCDSLRTGRKLNLTDRRYFQTVMKPDAPPLAVEPVFGRLTGIAVMQVAYAVRKETGEPRFVLLASLNLEEFMQSRAKTLPFSGAVIALMDGKGTVLSWNPEGGKLRGTSIADTPLARFALNGRGGNVQQDITFGGVSRIWAVSDLPEFPEAGLRVLVGVARADLLTVANRNLAQSLVVLAVVLLLVVVGAWALSELGIRRQIARINAAVTRFSGGDFSARIGQPYPRGEIGGLMAALDHDFGLIQEQREVIEQLNADLERRVTERTAQLAATNKELESFAYSVSHDLRMPLRHIDGYIELLAGESQGRLTGEAQRYLQVVTDASRKMGQLIDDLLAFSRMGRVELIESSVALDALVEETIQAMAPDTGQRNIAWTVQSLPVVRGDPVMLRQVFANLLGNAVKYTRPRDPARIEIGSLGEEEGRLILFVRDNGVGFEMKYADKLFGVFQRMHRADQFEGTGIGLASVRRIIARHGGRIWAEATLERGATFYFTLRAA
ncbi:MAG: ATP-binding protein [Betaproteobacteria bacterium]